MTDSEALKYFKDANRTHDMVCILPKSDIGKCVMQALEKQVPKKPIEMKPTDKLLNGYFTCSMCGGWVGMDEYSNKYCGCCGQAIDWSDGE